MRELYVPVGFAHGFCVLSDVADVLYKQTALLRRAPSNAGSPGTIPTWASSGRLPREELQVSARDAAAPRLSEIADELPFEWHP